MLLHGQFGYIRRKSAIGMTGLFKDRQTFQLPLLVIIVVAARLPFLYAPVPVPEKLVGGFLEAWFYQRLLPELGDFTLQVAALAWLLLCLFLASFTALQARLYSKSNMLAAFCMFMVAVMHPLLAAPSPALMMLPLLMLFFLNGLGMYATYKPVTTVVNAGMITGIGYLLYHPFLWVAVAGFALLGQMRAFRPKEWIQYVLAFMLPIYLVLAIQFLTNGWAPEKLLPHWGKAAMPPYLNGYWWLVLGMLMFLVAIAWPNWRFNLRRMLIQSRKNWYVVLLTGLFLLPSLVWPVQHFKQTLLLLSYPLGLLYANIFGGEKTIWKTILFWMWAGVAIAVSWAHMLGKV